MGKRTIHKIRLVRFVWGVETNGKKLTRLTITKKGIRLVLLDSDKRLFAVDLYETVERI